MPAEEWGLIVLTGLLSAPHCMGMCGGIISAVSLQTEESARSAVLYYNTGRIISYSILGLVMGAVGSFVETAGKLAGMQGIASIAGGLFVLLWLWRRFQLPFMERWTSFLQRRFQPAAGREGGKREAAHIVATGLSFGFLPCGLTYAMQMNAAASASIWKGAAIMALFGLATFPALALVGLIAGRAGKRWRRNMRLAGTAAAVLVGLLAILRGLSANGILPSISPWLW
ncbi:sulfite exporter TauE/SafE family protein [Paenibacillus sp. sptzw28]|uniref:sulfite exporter TauE/SafE family protein n=1 Tax=Paenibacillus sp. sptzw28 TaxID=715179 RepID=UPI001C6E373B|nr:sulfite exporter TauE/SafE family protein [Paenibacillus sp. sptzw28]QYR19691.1 sulfite exporter TauE/SafE family protein [Paenibacillus sp. sptzw28]